VFRNAFISACASRVVDQRLLRTWCGQMTAEMSTCDGRLYQSALQMAHESMFDRGIQVRPRGALSREDESAEMIGGRNARPKVREA
jgi:hypothetical protein